MLLKHRPKSIKQWFILSLDDDNAQRRHTTTKRKVGIR